MSGVAGMPLPDVFLTPCGTLAAYRRHLRRGDPVDESCRQAVVRAWEDRVAAGYQRPSRAGRVIAHTHLAGARAAAMCGKRRLRLVTDILDDVTCRGCLTVYRRHVAAEAKLTRERSRAA